MDTLTESQVQNLIAKAVTQAISYDSYRSLVEDLANTGDTTGESKTESLINYTQLNNRRMRRWDKTLKMNDAQIQRVKAFDSDVGMLLPVFR